MSVEIKVRTNLLQLVIYNAIIVVSLKKTEEHIHFQFCVFSW